MDAELKSFLEAMEQRLNQQNEQRLEALETRVKHYIDQRIEVVEARIERVETRLLTEFHKWASPVDARMRSHSAVMRALDLEQEALADRVSKLEKPRPGDHN